MNKQLEADILSLRKEIKMHDIAYYRNAEPVIPDYEYDGLVRNLKEKEKKLGYKLHGVSVLDSVGHGDTDNRIEHGVQMLSMDNVFNEDELRTWLEKIPDTTMCVEYKLDGLAVSLIYEDGVLTAAGTRGDGFRGEDVTGNIMSMPNIPHHLVNAPHRLEVRGEVIINSSEFIEINDKLVTNGEKPYSNPRNLAAGILNRDSGEDSDMLTFIAYGIGESTHQNSSETEITTHDDLLHYLRALKFDVVVTNQCPNIESIVDMIQSKTDSRRFIKYEVDGVVIKVNDLAKREEIGKTSKYPLWSIAWKFPANILPSVLKSVEWQVGKHGVLTPVAHITPVKTEGVVIQRVTLHNRGEIKRLNLAIGDHLEVIRSGGVIPKIVGSKPGKDRSKIHIPSICPVCSSGVIKDGSVALRCTNGMGCSAQGKKKLASFVSRKGMDVRGLGLSVLSDLYDAGMVIEYEDIYKLTADKLKQLDGIQDKSATNILQAIEKSKSCRLEQFLYSLSIEHASEGTSKRLAIHFMSIDKILNATYDDFITVDDIGEVVAMSLVTYFTNRSKRDTIADLLALGVTPTYAVPSKQISNSLLNNTYVMTGSVDGFNRKEIKEYIEQRGGKLTNSLSGRTTGLIVGNSPGASKVKKAKTLGIPEVEFSTL